MRRTVLLLATIVSSALAATSPVPHGTVELIPEMDHFQPGTPFTVGLHFELEPGWHIYWKNPGDSGQPPRVEWSLPTGLSASAIEWPLPKRLPVGPLLDYGYEGNVLLPITLTPSPDFSQTTEADLRGNLRVLVCREICIPGKASLELKVPVRGQAPKPVAKYAELFASARQAMPVSLPADWRVSASSDGAALKLDLTGVKEESGISFFPAQPDVIENAAPQRVSGTASGTTIVLKRAAGSAQLPPKLEGLLVLPATDGANKTRGYTFAANIAATAASAPIAGQPSNLFLVIAFAFLGGIILNLMPCVFPVLSLKALHLLESADKDQRTVRFSALFYTAGILVSFWILVGALLALRAGGSHLGWGFQLQSPAFVAFLACFLFLFGLSLAGMFEIGQSFMGAGSGLAQRSGFAGSFFTGVLATVVATPCTAPFMGAAVGFALSQSILVCTSVFTALALGLASPFLLLAFVPQLGRFLPRPGRWMESFKQFLAFLIFGAVIWLLWVFGQQSGIDRLTVLLGSLLFISVAGWMLNRWGRNRFAVAAAVAIILCAVVYPIWAAASSVSVSATTDGTVSKNGLKWEAFSAEKLANYRAAGKPVLIDFTAAWCLTCQVNDRVVFQSSAVIDKLKKADIALLRADWTSNDPAITEALAQYGRSAVPLYVLYSPSLAGPKLLPDGLLRPATFLEAMQQANL